MNNEEQRLHEHLTQLHLTFMVEHDQPLADQAAREQWTPLQYLARLLAGVYKLASPKRDKTPVK